MEKLEERCPRCADDVKEFGEGCHMVYAAMTGKYKGLPKCHRCGAYLVDGEWIYECKTCGERVDGLYGLFVPHNCKPCQDKVETRQRRTGQVCTRCRQVYARCCC